MTGRPKLCPKCRKLVGADDQTCYHCGADLGMRGRLLAGATRTATSAGEGVAWWRLVLLANVALFVIGLAVTLRSGADVSGAGLFGLLSPSNSVQLQLGLQVQALVFAGEWWRLITCLFLHGGLMHIGFNMYFLAQLGPTAEQLFGNRGFLLIYILGGLTGSLVELALGNPVLGASGSIMALIGALAGLGMRRAGTWDNELTREMFRILLFVTVFGLIVGSVAHGAHLGGFVGGGLTLLLVEGLRSRRAYQALSGLSAATAGLVAASFLMMGFNLQKPTLGELQAYEKCVQQGVGMLSKPERRKASGWRCYDDLRPQLEGVPAEVLDGLAELIEQPDIPGGGERANALIGQHNEWIRAEARRLGLLR